MDKIRKLVSDLREKYYKYGEDASSKELDAEIEKILHQLDSNFLKIQFLQDIAFWRMYHTSKAKLVESLFLQLRFDEFGENLLKKLKAVENDICLYLNPKLLSEKFKNFEKYIAIFATDNVVQGKLSSLSDANLKFLEDIINVLEQSGAHEGELFAPILDNIGSAYVKNRDEYKSLNMEIERLYEDGGNLNEKQIEKLMFLYTSKRKEDVKSIEELETLDEKRKTRLINIVNTSNDIEEVKEEVLQYAYGISTIEAKDIIDKYKVEPEKCTTEELKKMLVQYDAIRAVAFSNDLSELKMIGENLSKLDIKASYLRNTVLHSEFRNMFLHEYNDNIYKIQPEDKIRVDDDTIDVYKINSDFNMIVTCIGAYQCDFKEQENYDRYWNQPHIKHITNPCSLIGNDNLTTATIKNVVFGFNDFNENMLFNAFNMDYNSSPNIQSPRYTSKGSGSSFFAFLQTLKNNTRSQYNELMFERRNGYAIDDVYKKKQPSYIVFFEEFENERIFDVTDEVIDKMEPEKRMIMLEQKRMWNESKKAAKDFNIPLVIVNREECAIREKEKIKKMLEEIKLGNEEKVVELITKFENGRISYGDSHKYIREKYFSKEEMDSILESLLAYHNPKINKLVFSAIKEEEGKWKIGESRCLDGQSSAIDFEKYRNIEAELKGSVDIGE